MKEQRAREKEKTKQEGGAAPSLEREKNPNNYTTTSPWQYHVILVIQLRHTSDIKQLHTYVSLVISRHLCRAFGFEATVVQTL